MGLIATFRLLNNIRGRPLDNHFESGSAGEARLVLYVIAGMIAYALLLDFIGFLFCTFPLVAFYLKVIAARRCCHGIGRGGAAPYQGRQAHRPGGRRRVGDPPGCADIRQAGLCQVNLLASVAFLAPKGLPEATAKVLTDAIRKSVQERKLQENLRSRGYNIDLRTAEADVNKLVKDEINKYSRFTPEDLGWKAQ
jgi:hypothetical protein